MELLVICLLLAAMLLMLTAIAGFLKIRHRLQTELYGSHSGFNALTVAYTTLMCFFLVAYAAFLAHTLRNPSAEPIRYLLTLLLFFGSVFVGLSVKVIANSIDVVLGVKLNELDTMTGLMTKTGFEMAAQKVLDGGQGDYALVVADMDHFKMINDTFGHEKGDEVIRCTAQTIRETVRTSDLVGRFGGDEFVILLHGTNASQVAGIMERIDRTVVQLQKERGCEVCAGLSYGAADLRGGSKAQFADVFAEADRAMFEMKRAKQRR